MSKLGYVVSFIFGSVVGAAAMYFYIENKEEEIFFEEEEPEVKPEPKSAESKDPETVAAKNHNKDSILKYAEIASKYTEKNDLKEKAVMGDVYVIPPDQFGEDETYDTVTFSWYVEDQVLADGNGERIPDEDIPDIVADAVDHFGEYEDDCVYVVNHKLNMYIEVLLDLGRWESDE